MVAEARAVDRARRPASAPKLDQPGGGVEARAHLGAEDVGASGGSRRGRGGRRRARSGRRCRRQERSGRPRRNRSPAKSLPERDEGGARLLALVRVDRGVEAVRAELLLGAPREQVEAAGAERHPPREGEVPDLEVGVRPVAVRAAPRGGEAPREAAGVSRERGVAAGRRVLARREAGRE